jgi:hypothetical protein
VLENWLGSDAVRGMHGGDMARRLEEAMSEASGSQKDTIRLQLAAPSKLQYSRSQGEWL